MGKFLKVVAAGVVGIALLRPTFYLFHSVVTATGVHPDVVALLVCGVMSVLAFGGTLMAIPGSRDLFIAAKMFGRDLNKVNSGPIPEPAGLPVAAVYLITLFFFIPFPFVAHWYPTEDGSRTDFPHHKFVEFVTACLCICCMVFLGFADDVLNLRWRYKLFLPTIASLPLLMVYMVNIGSTYITVPSFLHPTLGTSIDLGILYYVYMGSLTLFCTNSINILAGINGIEAGQSFVIAVSIFLNNLIQYLYYPACPENHLFSMFFILPFIATTAGLLWFNLYPSQVFVGDTYCYFAGMTFAVVGILGHFSKTLLLFFIPQIINFIYSCPQLFHLIPCPRHRLPKYHPEDDLCHMSKAVFKPSELSTPGRMVYNFLVRFGLVHVQPHIAPVTANGIAPAAKSNDSLRQRKNATGTNATGSQPAADDETVEVNNLTIINIFIRVLGPTNEGKLTNYILLFQAFCSGFAFATRYYFVYALFDKVE